MQVHFRATEHYCVSFLSAVKGYFRHRPGVWLTSVELCALMVLMLWGGIIGKHFENRRQDSSGAERDLHDFSLLFEENVLRSIGEMDKALRYLRNSIGSSNDGPDYRRLVSADDILSDIIVQVAIIDENGVMKASSAGGDNAPALDLSDREHFQFHRDKNTDELFISRPMIGRASGKMSVQLTRRFLTKNGQFGGVAVVSFDPNHFDRLFNRMSLRAEATFALLGTDGVICALGGKKGDSSLLGSLSPEAPVLAKLEDQVSTIYWDPIPKNSSQDLVVLRRVAGHPLAVSARMPSAAVFSGSNQSLVTMTVVGAALSLIIAGIGRQGMKLELRERREAEQLQSSHAALLASHAQLNMLHTDLELAAADARHQQSLFKSVFESAPDGLVHLDAEYNIITCNSALISLFGFSVDDLRSRNIHELFSSTEDYDDIAAHIEGKNNNTHARPLHCIRKDGSVFPVHLTGARMLNSSGEPTGFIGVIRDVTVQQRHESMLREGQRLEVLGRLTGGIAHNFNNLLTVVSGNLQLVEIGLEDARQKSLLAAASSAIEMGARLNQRLISFSRQRRLDPQQQDMHCFIQSMYDLLCRSVGESIEVKMALAAEDAWVLVDTSEMENAILNIALNARDAMANGGTLLWATRNIDIDNDASRKFVGLQPGRYFGLSATDTGTGMPKEVLSRVFEPFFSTREDGKGTGLGLTTIQGFVRQSGGDVSVDSLPGHGTTVSIYLPVLAGAKDKGLAGSLRGAEPVERGRGELILVVEDSLAVRRVTAEHLRVLGYRVIDVGNASDALQVVAERKDDVDLVFSDIVMPGISGFELAKRLRSKGLDLKVLLTSGFPDEVARIEDVGDRSLFVLRKPYRQEELARRISEALGRA